jgi:CheY-like chemotaxis protein
MLAHELRNPLAPVRNGVELLKQAGGADAVAEVAAMMDRQVSQLIRLVDDLLDVSRISQGKIALRREPVPLERVVRQAVEAARPAIDRLGHELQVDLPPGSVWLDADPARLSQVVSNLLNNACKFTPSSGRIDLSARAEGGQVELRVRDTGIGIPREALAAVFDMFVQVDRSAERSQGGLGLGLTLVKWLVELHGGTVEARSAGPGQGSEFVVRLPALPGPPPAAPPAPPGLDLSRRLPILVVDDNRDAAHSLARLLRVLHYEVETAHDGPSALAASSAFRPRVVLLDIGMPGMSGYEVARQLRQRCGRGEVLLIALTGYGTEDDRLRSAEAGFDAHLTKPVDLVGLKELLARFASA